MKNQSRKIDYRGKEKLPEFFKKHRKMGNKEVLLISRKTNNFLIVTEKKAV